MHLLREFSSIMKQWRKIALTRLLIEISQSLRGANYFWKDKNQMLVMK